MAMAEMHKDFGEDRTCSSEDRQTHKVMVGTGRIAAGWVLLNTRMVSNTRPGITYRFTVVNFVKVCHK